jgi:regulator of replication initiation timing
MLEGFDPNTIHDVEGARQAIVQLLNLVEDLASDNRALRDENQRLRDENNRLKGEQGKPQIKPNRSASPPTTTNHSSERERHKYQAWKKGGKVERIEVKREEVLTVDPARLPADAEFKGYDDVLVQDIKIETDNVLFHKEKFYSKSERAAYLAELPHGYAGQFGPGVKALTVVLYHAANLSEPKVSEFFEFVGVHISEGEVSNLLIKDQDDFHTEKEAVYAAGLRSSPWQHMDETGTRVNGVNEHCHTVCNPLYTAYVTTGKKDRLAVLEALLNGRALTLRLNAEAYAWLTPVGLPASALAALQQLPQDQALSETEFIRQLAVALPTLGSQARRRVLEAAAVAAYHAQQDFPVVDLLLCDDADQFKRLTRELALCWIHDARHYKKLNPAVPYHRTLLDTFMGQYWGLYDDLLTYRQASTPDDATRLSQRFDDLFATKTGYVDLDERIVKTRAKKDALLMVLKHPEIPLHNNPAELAARRRVRKRDVSFGPRTEEGKQAWDTFMTLADTAKKLGVSFYRYVYDRVSQANQIPQLADLIVERAKQLGLGTSWNTT